MQPRPEQSVSVWPYASDQRPARRVLMVATTAQNSPIYNLDASNAMQIMSFRFAIKMLNRYFCPQTGEAKAWRSRFDPGHASAHMQCMPPYHTPSIGAVIRHGLLGPQTTQHMCTCHYGFDLLFAVLRYQFIYYF